MTKCFSLSRLKIVVNLCRLRCLFFCSASFSCLEFTFLDLTTLPSSSSTTHTLLSFLALLLSWLSSSRHCFSRSCFHLTGCCPAASQGKWSSLPRTSACSCWWWRNPWSLWNGEYSRFVLSCCEATPPDTAEKTSAVSHCTTICWPLCWFWTSPSPAPRRSSLSHWSRLGSLVVWRSGFSRLWSDRSQPDCKWRAARLGSCRLPLSNPLRFQPHCSLVSGSSSADSSLSLDGSLAASRRHSFIKLFRGMFQR